MCLKTFIELWRMLEFKYFNCFVVHGDCSRIYRSFETQRKQHQATVDILYLGDLNFSCLVESILQRGKQGPFLCPIWLQYATSFRLLLINAKLHEHSEVFFPAVCRRDDIMLLLSKTSDVILEFWEISQKKSPASWTSQIGGEIVLKITQLVQRLIQRHSVGLSRLCTLDYREW